MNAEFVRQLEEEFAGAMADVLKRQHRALPAPQVLHLMAKAAVTVLEATEVPQDAASPRKK